MVTYRDDVDAPGEPRSRGKEAPGPAGALTGNVGPLPVWGWGIVAVGAVVLWRKVVSPPKAAPVLTGTTIPAYPAAQNGGLYFYGDPTTTTPAAPAPAAGILPTNSSGWGPDYPATAPGTVPDRACKPGRFAVTSFSQNWWSCETFQQLTDLMNYLPTVKGDPNPADHPTTAPTGSAVNCPAGYTLTPSAGGLTCIPKAA